MTANKKKLYAFERSIQVIEQLSQSNSFSVSDESFQALYNTGQKLKEMFTVPDESITNGFLALET
ncbi:MAG: hypothetical protein D3925_03920 [Candidatus Electrothrix sp. AR5]|nr:hypothetical protein [Candidatus Electrothrix sp. AR5]